MEYINRFNKRLQIAVQNEDFKGSKNLLINLIKWFANFLIYGCTITDYFELTFWKKSAKEKRQYITWRYHKKFIYSVDDKASIKFLSNKENMYKALGSDYKRNHLYINEINEKTLNDFLNKTPIFFYKPNDGSCGMGIKKYITKDLDRNKILKKFKKLPAGTLDSAISQNKELSRLHPDSLNTLRIFTLRINGEIYFTGSVLRIGNGSFIDNYSAGGLVLAIDNESGKAIDDAEDYMGHRYEQHPITKYNFDDFTVPKWGDIKKFVKKLAIKYPLNYVAWDIGLDKNDKIEIIEANPGGMINLIQIAGAGGRLTQYKKLKSKIESSRHS